jgi:hypothetical protein
MTHMMSFVLLAQRLCRCDPVSREFVNVGSKFISF